MLPVTSIAINHRNERKTTSNVHNSKKVRLTGDIRPLGRVPDTKSSKNLRLSIYQRSLNNYYIMLITYLLTYANKI